MTLSELKQPYLEYLFNNRERALTTIQAYDFDLTKFIIYLHEAGIDNPKSVTTRIIEDYLQRNGKPASYIKKISPATKSRTRSSIRSYFRYLHRREYISIDPSAVIESINVKEARREYLTREEYFDFIKTVEHTSTPFYRMRDITLIKLLIKSGLRRSEVAGLKVGDVELSKLQFRVKRKGGRDEFALIHQELANDLKLYLKVIKRADNEPLFISKKDNQLSASSIWHLIKKYSKDAGLNGKVTVHSLRHSFASILLSQDVPLPYIQALMGHKSPLTTSRYLHIENKNVREALNKVNFDERR